jgi:type III pantothenate kinase
MLLVVDIGNTNVTLGLFPMDQGRPASRLRASWRLSTLHHGTSDEYGMKILALARHAAVEPAHIRAMAVASVVPPLDPVFQDVGKAYFHLSPLFVGPDIETGVKVLYANPSEVGADRIVNAAAAYDLVKGACLIVDFGTATTFDCVNSRGDYMGGVIAPGPRMAAEALAQKTAKLPLVGAFRRPSSVIGKTTMDSLLSGLFYGYAGLTEEILRRLKNEMGGNPVVLATGGLAPLMRSSVKSIKRIEPDLTLQGLRLIWERNR